MRIVAHADRHRRRRPAQARPGARARGALSQARGRCRPQESIAVANIIPERAVTVILDQRGESMSSSSFAGRLQGWRTENKAAVVFVVGGADGLAPNLRENASLAIAFGAATWPHQLVRVMLLEQLYRAITILAGHPYHRA